ncbi:MAG: GNAT family N-acetyltransferase [Candidatus Wallbacteria bacterium HGW-Wallbacteria-1]|jgi:GNAT superfamily N-acetyltransferase|uniref:GNAT family N-acetyltransferase n=1 Tax=Candidatus Wallbacteria bacterium HGW-Wallbacteria-1 TaxID=2013854 RepID=A0A2N1PJZ1_9BACT|nr:MAG: GNAT family N-acetyltransferase [Candidatus Wallbacteria bacterium HGW-Wallbacteria-1]
MKEIIYRLLEPSDSIAEITDLVHRAYAFLADMGLNFWATHQSEDDTASRLSRGKTWLALCRGRIIGTITLANAWETDGCSWYDKEEVTSFGQFAVDPQFQSQGVGSRLLSLAEEGAREAGIAHLALDTAESATHLIDYYRARGYEIVDRVDWEGTNYISVVMSKALLS